MKNIQPFAARFIVVLVFAASLSICACHQSQSVTVYTMAPAMKAGFDFKPGSYWVYKDSVSGEMDSAYVTDNITNYSPISSCAPNETLHEFVTVQITVVKINNPGPPPQIPPYEAWSLYMYDSCLNLSLINNADSVESNEIGQTLAKYPFETGYYSLHTGCVFEGYEDSANVTSIIPLLSVNGQAYSTIAVSYHGNGPGHSSNDVYDDTYYVSADAGIVKIAFNHHPNSMHRVLELQRYKLVK